MSKPLIFLILLTVGTMTALPADTIQAAVPATSSSVIANQGLTPTRLRRDYRVGPLGIDSPNPRLDWTLSPGDPSVRGVTPRAYRILVASSP